MTVAVTIDVRNPLHECHAMMRFACAALLLAACGTEQDDRPLELPYLTQAIFAPTCGTAQCHSTFARAAMQVFDTPDGVRRTLVDKRLIQFDSEKYDPAEPANANLIIWITETDPFGRGIGRMPLDAPMPNRDVQLLQEWISVGAPGAQCDPEASSGMACKDNEVVRCNADWTFGDRVMLCAGSCIQGACS